MSRADYRPNPFQVLGLPVDASDEQIVARAAELARTCGDDERELVVRAERELLTDPRGRARHARTEPRRTDYAREERWNAFVRRHRGSPVSAQMLAELTDGSPLRPEDLGFPAAIRILAQWAAASRLDAIDPPSPPLPSTDADGVARPHIRDVLFG